MIKRSTAVIACVLVCVLSIACTGLLAVPGTILFYDTIKGNNTPAPADTHQPAQEGELDFELMQEIADMVMSMGIWPGDAELLTRNAIQGIVYADGDIYAEYYNEQEYNDLLGEREGNYVGIGVSVAVDNSDGLVTVRAVYDDSPALAAGVQVGDKIIAVDDQDVTQHTMDELVNLVRGEEGSQVKLGLWRGEETLDVTATRASVMQQKTSWELKQDGVGYISIVDFNGNAYTRFEQAIEEMSAQGMKGLILDLRNNPGGMQDIVVDIADMLLPQGSILRLVDRDGNIISDDVSDADMLGIPMVVLVNEYSASASELLAGSIQDYGVGAIVGKTTYGKGVAQSFFPLSNGGVLKMTATRYLTGGGQSPQGVGIIPDIEVDLPEDVYEDYINRYCNPEYDRQYAKALEELNRRIAAGE